jgi:RNA polymerase sigma-70 factor, ECF subfamily
MLGRATKLRRDFEREALPHLSALYGTALRLTRNDRDAEDLVQDTMLRAYQYFGKFTPGSNCKAWIFKILTNLFINRYHARRRDQKMLVSAMNAADEPATHEIVSREVSHAARDPESAVASRMLSDDVVRALESLPAEFRLAVLLCDVEEFSYKEIAEILECPVGTVMSRLFRARRLLARALHEYAVEQGIIRPLAATTPDGGADDGVADLEAFRRSRRGLPPGER